MTGLVVAMDGPSGSGKSSTSRGVARALGLRYLDTGAMYRAITWWMLEHGVDVDDPPRDRGPGRRPGPIVGHRPRRPTIAVDGSRRRRPDPRPGGHRRGQRGERGARRSARRLVREQREIIGDGGIVVEGRDIGTVVAPDAPVKVYLTADPAARGAPPYGGAGPAARRGPAEGRHGPAGHPRLDAATSPLAMAADAHELDTPRSRLDEVVAEVLV